MFAPVSSISAAEDPPVLLLIHAGPRRTRLLRANVQRWKRIFDIVSAAILGVLALPLAAVIAVAIKFDSPGPILFTHTRIGRRNRRFRLWKFRSMVRDADRILSEFLSARPERGEEWRRTRKLRDDPRVTRVGRLLRKTSLDELPQLWNVLRGEMSLIGPRPIVAQEIPRYGATFHLYRQVSPGLTGLWQVSGRNDTSYRRRVALDSDYIRHWTPRMDLAILLKTVRVVLVGHGAY
jgi:Undecaprenyl-phosphate galactose phosphotransferase WbaP